MKISDKIKSIVVLLFFSISHVLYSQCTVESVSDSGFDFPAIGGYEIVTIVTDPFGCTPSFSSPSWIHLSTYSDEEIELVCDVNTGPYRQASVSVGAISIYVSQYAGTLVGGSISGTSGQTAMYVCYNTSPGTISNTTYPSGGTCGGSYTYQWEKSVTSSTSGYSSISGATGSAYTPSSLISTTYFRRKVTCGSATAYSNVVTVTVRPVLYGGLLTDGQYICYLEDAGLIGSSEDATGGSGSYNYNWEKSEDGGTNWTSAGGSSTTFDPYILSTTTQYRRKVTDTYGCTAYSDIVEIQVMLQLSGGTISGDETICYNADASDITSSSVASGGSGSYTYSWEKSEDGGINWTSAGGSSTTFNPSMLTDTTKYRRKVTDNTCSGTAYSNQITKTVRPELTGGTISGDETIFYNGNPSDISSITDASGGSTSFTYNWEKSTDGGTNWTPAGGSLTTFDPNILTATTRYQRKVTDNNGCGIAYSNTISITVKTFAIPDTNMNYIYTIEPTVGLNAITESMSFDSLRFVIQYFDGLGRPLQNIQAMSTPNHNDIITPVSYDEFGREAVKYLPYSKPGNGGTYVPGAIDEQAQFFNANDYFPGDTANAKTVFESSPLNRVLEQGAPGTVWQPENGHVSKFDYGSNSQYDVLKWIVSGDSCINTGGEASNNHHFYPSSMVFKNVIKDENWVSGLMHTTEEYKDFQGNVVLKRSYVISDTNKVETYYVYDDFGLLRYVIPPEAINHLGSTTILTQTSDLVKNWCYYYQYDSRKRMIIKQLPGADTVYMVYDKRDRLVATQDGNQRDSVKWIFTKYNVFNNPILTGIYSSSASRETLQTEAYTFTGDSLFEIAGAAVHGYTNRSFPDEPDSTKYYTITYYDNYTYSGAKSFNTPLNISGYSDSDGNVNYFDGTRSLITGTKTLVLDGGSTYLTSTIYYDDKYRPIQVLRDLYDGGTGEEITSNRYNFIGQVNETKVSQRFNSVTTTVNKYYTYDHMGRLLKNELELGVNRITLAEMEYNELGQVKQKNLNVTTSGALQEVDYKYNIRGWLTGINDPSKLQDDLFAMSLYYNDNAGVSPLTSEAQFNGNISGIKWKSGQGGSVDTLLKAYGYTYDELSRIKASDYGEGYYLTTNYDRYNESVGSYDLNGNINSLTRNGYNQQSNQQILNSDILRYTYSGGRNQLQKIVDNGNKSFGFIDNSDTTVIDYAYDSNGNLIRDLNKGISSVEYNFFNLPSEVKKDTNNKIEYIYDAIGTKLKKSSTIGGATTNRYYTGGFEYLGDSLALIHTDEGMVNVTGTRLNPLFTYEYFVKDHLGNLRTAFQPSGDTLILTQQTDYYPFGMISNSLNSSDNKYLYNGKELQDESLGGVNLDWYDYGSRYLDPQIGRFMTQDAFAEKYFDLSPYQYATNNPINIIDINGDSIWYTRNENVITMQITGKVMNSSSDNIDMNRAIADMTADLEDTFKGKFEANGETFEFKTEAKLSEAKSMDDVNTSDHLVVFADGKGEEGSTRGTTNMIGGKTIHLYSDDYPKQGIFSGSSKTRTSVHEFGHAAGLEHTDTKYNLMVQRGMHSNVTPNQLGYMVRNRNNINKGINYYYDPVNRRKIPYPFLHYRGETSNINRAGFNTK